MKTRVTTRVVHRRRRRKPSAMKGEKKASAESSALALVLLRTHVHGRTTSAASRTLPKRRAIRGKFAALISKAPQDVPRKDWRDYLDGFSVEHEGQPTQIRAFMPDQSSRLEAHDLPLEGVSVDTSQSETFASVIAGEEARHILRTSFRAQCGSQCLAKMNWRSKLQTAVSQLYPVARRESKQLDALV